MGNGYYSINEIVKSDYWLIIECDEPFHEGSRIIAVLSRTVKSSDDARLALSYWWFAALLSREWCSSGICKEDILPGGVTMSTIDDNNLTARYGTRSACAEVLDFDTTGKGVESHGRIQLKCPHCSGIDVQLNITCPNPDAHACVVCPTLDKITDAGLKRISLRLLAHAVSYGVK